MLHAFKLYTGPDKASHVAEGTIAENDSSEVVSAYFKESPPHSSLDWHDAPEMEYVITLSGTLEFTTRDGEQFVVHPGDVLVAEDNVGSGHKWRLIDESAVAPSLRCAEGRGAGFVCCQDVIPRLKSGPRLPHIRNPRMCRARGTRQNRIIYDTSVTRYIDVNVPIALIGLRLGF